MYVRHPHACKQGIIESPSAGRGVWRGIQDLLSWTNCQSKMTNCPFLLPDSPFYSEWNAFVSVSLTCRGRLRVTVTSSKNISLFIPARYFSLETASTFRSVYIPTNTANLSSEIRCEASDLRTKYYSLLRMDQKGKMSKTIYSYLSLPSSSPKSRRSSFASTFCKVIVHLLFQAHSWATLQKK